MPRSVRPSRDLRSTLDAGEKQQWSMECDEQPDAYISEVRCREAHWFSDWDGTIPSAGCEAMAR